MCGICGYIKIQDSQFISRDTIVSMCDSMTHRGPDGYGVWQSISNNVGLGHRRLAIIDLSEKASQPMLNEDGTIAVVFNGEIYNHEEIRAEIEKLGDNRHSWKTNHSDTEVLIHAYEEWGIEFVSKLRGMFSFCIYDQKKDSMWLIRDRIGIKPLYYCKQAGILYFASEIKALLKIGVCEKKLDERAVFDYLSFLSTPSEQTILKDVKKVRPGEYLHIDKNKRIEKTKYYDILDNINLDIARCPEGEINSLLIDELRKAVNYRKESDVPVGCFLSGGIDSSTNVALFTENSSSKVKTFCVGYPSTNESYASEFEYARGVANQFGTEHYEYVISNKDYEEIIDKICFQMDEPVGDVSCIPIYYLSKLAKENGITVAQVGEGSDELFFGYPSWNLRHKLSSFFWDEKNYGLARSAFYFGKTLCKDKLYFEWIRRLNSKQPLFWGGTEGYTDYRKRKILSPMVLTEIGDYSSYEAIKGTYENFVKKAPEKTPFNWMSYCDLNHRLPEVLLMRVDKMSMMNSLECRVPFLDHKFVELVYSIPEKYKVDHYKNKSMLKKSVRGLIPDTVIDRKKQGFGAPLIDWFNSDYDDRVRKTIRQFAEETGFLSQEYVDQHLNESLEWNDWYLFVLSNWWIRINS